MRKFLRSSNANTPTPESLVAQLRREGIQSERVLDAISHVPRDQFVPSRSKESSWSNAALPIGQGQTISQPYVVAIMTEAVDLNGTEHVLEIGAGSGYQSAILAQLAKDIVSIERLPALADEARKRLASLGVDNVTIIVGDGSVGYPPQAPYDAIVVTAGTPTIPQQLIDQLSPTGGKMVIPVGDANGQDLVVVVRHGDETTLKNLGPVAFVPLIGAEGWPNHGDPRSHGESQMQESIPAGAVIGHVHLKVSDLNRSIAFYRDALGLDVTEQIGDHAAFLSAGGYHHHIGLNTWESLNGQPPPPGSTGLYHFAIRYPSRPELARAYQRLRTYGVRIDGASDHGVSHAIYLHDPDHNGIEIYWDLPRDEWPRDPDGSLRMKTAPLDLQGLLEERSRFDE